ncbi:MAG: tetratricopeptide repeat protein [Gemmatimonadetes bacterium]|nr:tetratricopeptide repeat protein [Gemmatimonadota bacterium]
MIARIMHRAACAALIAAIVLIVTTGCTEPEPVPDAPVPPDSVEAVSLLGEALFAREDTTGAIARADSALAADSTDIERLLAAAAARAEVWQYNAAIALYTRGMTIAPDDWRLYRFRGHRYISTRRLAEAVTDLERAAQLSPASFDVVYHLGLAYFLSGRFDAAVNTYGRCVDLARAPGALTEAQADLERGFRGCTRIATDPATRVAITDWLVRAFRRAGRAAGADSLLPSIEPGWTLASNTAYYRNLLYYKGILTEADILAGGDSSERFETRAAGVANQRLVAGDTAGALELFERIVQDPHWPGFGRIAAEAELARLQPSRALRSR